MKPRLFGELGGFRCPQWQGWHRARAAGGLETGQARTYSQKVLIRMQRALRRALSNCGTNPRGSARPEKACENGGNSLREDRRAPRLPVIDDPPEEAAVSTVEG